MDAAMEQFRALLAACVAVSRAAASPTTAPNAGDADARIRLVDATVGLAPECLPYWDSLCADDASPAMRALAEDLGALLASTNVSDPKIVELLRVLLVHPSFHAAGVLRLSQLTFRGLKLAKRWETLTLVSTELLDAVYASVLQADTRARALRFFIDILVGFQHSAELYERNVPKLVALAELLADGSEEANNNELVHPFVVA
ncbi:hypothetical protein BBJ28_00025534, partial [Nothophytophthora sp. Chile5]